MSSRLSLWSRIREGIGWRWASEIETSGISLNSRYSGAKYDRSRRPCNVVTAGTPIRRAIGR